MSNVIVAFPKMENAKSIKNILVKSGYDVAAVCTTGAQTLQSANALEGGIVICSHHFIDMMYQELYEYLPPQFQMLLVASPAVCSERRLRTSSVFPCRLKCTN